MIALIYAPLILGIGLIIWALTGANIYVSTRVKLPAAAEQTKKVKMHSFLAVIFPFSRKLMEKFGWEAQLKSRLAAAHSRLSAVEFFNSKLILIIVLCVLGLIGFGKMPIWLLGLCLLIGYAVPEILLNRKIAQRRYAIARLLPETIDLLGLCVEAGLDFVMAVKWIIEKTPMNPLLEEMAFVLEEIKWGKPRSQALRDMSHRLGISEISSFVQTLVLAERMGTPVADAFTILSEDARLQRFHRGERFAMKAPIKILIPLIFCILPVIAIVVGGPILLQFMQGNIFAVGGK